MKKKKFNFIILSFGLSFFFLLGSIFSLYFSDYKLVNYKNDLVNYFGFPENAELSFDYFFNSTNLFNDSYIEPTEKINEFIITTNAQTVYLEDDIFSNGFKVNAHAYLSMNDMNLLSNSLITRNFIVNKNKLFIDAVTDKLNYYESFLSVFVKESYNDKIVIKTYNPNIRVINNSSVPHEIQKTG